MVGANTEDSSDATRTADIRSGVRHPVTCRNRDVRAAIPPGRRKAQGTIMDTVIVIIATAVFLILVAPMVVLPFLSGRPDRNPDGKMNHLPIDSRPPMPPLRHDIAA